MDPNSSTFCVNYLSQFPLIKPETINTLCFNGFTSFHQLARLDDSDLPFIRDISVEQKAAVKRALIRFAGHANGGGLDGAVTISSSSVGQMSGNGASDEAGSSGAKAGSSDGGGDSEHGTGGTSGCLVLNGSGNSNSNSAGGGGHGGGCGTRNGTISNSALNSFYSTDESSGAVVVEVSAASPASLDGSSSGSSKSSNSGNNGTSARSHLSNSVSTAARDCQQVSASASASKPAAASAANGADCHSRPRPSASVSHTTPPVATARSPASEVIAAVAEAALTTETAAAHSPPSSRLILLPGKNNSSSTSSIYQRIDQFDLAGSGTINNDHGGSGNNKCGGSKLGEVAGNSNSAAASSGGSWSKRRKQNETVTAAVNSADALSAPSSSPPPSSSSSSSSSPPSTLHSAPHSELPLDLEKSLPGAVATEPQPVYKRPKRLIRVNAANSSDSNGNGNNEGTQPSASTATPTSVVRSAFSSLARPPSPAVAPVGPSDSPQPQAARCGVITDSRQLLPPIAECLQSVNELQPGTVSLSDPVHCSFVQSPDDGSVHPVTSTTFDALPMPYAILEQLDCTKKLENGQKPLLYHFSTVESNDGSKKELIAADSGRSMSALSQEVNYLVTSGKLNSPGSTVAGQFESLSSANHLSLIIDSSQLNNFSPAPAKSPSPVAASAASSNTSAVASINSAICSTGASGPGEQQHAITLTSQPSAAGNLLNAALHMPSNVVVSSENAILQSTGASASALSATDSMAIRDYLSEINVVPVSNGNGGQLVDTVQLSNSVANHFISPAEHQQLVKNANIILDQSQQLDPNQLNNYVYSTLQLQLTPLDSIKPGIIEADNTKSPSSSLFTLAPANHQPATLSPTQQTPIGQQVVNAVQQQQQQQQQGNAASRRGRGRPKKYSDPLSMAVEQCLENSNSPTQTTTPAAATGGMTAFSGSVQTVISTVPGTPTVHHCRWAGCGFSSTDILEFRNHNRTMHRDESTIIPSRKGKSAAPKEPLICEVPGCGYSPKYRRLLIDHQNAHKGLRAHKCCFCEYNSSYFGDIRKHMIKKHPDLAQEIKLSKLKLKQNGLDGKGGKLTKAELDELAGTVTPKPPRSKKTKQAAAGEAGMDNGSAPKKRNYAKKSRKKKGEAEAANQTTAFDISNQDPKTALALSNLGLSAQPTNTQQYNFIPASTQGYGLQPEHLMSNNTYSTLNASLGLPQTAIIYLQTGPNGQTVQLAANDLNSLNQLIGYDINALNGQIAMAPGHQVQNLGATFATATTQQQQGQQHGRPQHETNGLTSICLDGGNGGSATFALLTDPNQQQGQGGTTIYKCDYPLCYFQTDQYEAILIHKHRDHALNQGQGGNGQQQQQQQQITIIDASTLTAVTGNQTMPQVSQHQISSHLGHHQLSGANTNVVTSSAYVLAPSNTVTSSNFGGIDYSSLITTTATNQMMANVAETFMEAATQVSPTILSR